MSTDLAIRAENPGALSRDEFDALYRQARALAASGMFKDATQADQAFAKLVLGRDFGLSPTQAMTAINIVEGKPELSANLQAAMLRAYRGPAGEQYNYRRVSLTGDECRLEFFFRPAPGDEWESLGEEVFTMADAERAGLLSRGNNKMYEKYPRNMLFARCLSNGVAFLCPEVTFGHRVFGPGEVSEHDPGFDPATQTMSVVRAPDEAAVRDVPADAAPEEGEQIVEAELVEDDDERDPAGEDHDGPLPDTGPFDPTPAGVVEAFNASGEVTPDSDTRAHDRLIALLDRVSAHQDPSVMERIKSLDDRQAATVIAGLA